MLQFMFYPAFWFNFWLAAMTPPRRTAKIYRLADHARKT